MDYCKELRELLRPLGLYDVDGGASGAELTGLGQAMNVILQTLELAEQESTPVTAQDAGLSGWETLLPFTPASSTVQERRAAIAALLRIDEASFTPDAVSDTLTGCGIAAAVTETETPLTVEVRFPGCRGIPAAFAALQSRIEQILPCHLDILYVFSYLLWREVAGLFASWNALAAQALTWDALERLGGEEA